jgi:poly(A)-specific ribonuclease
MDISRSRFPLELVNIIQLVADSHFIAFDLEFSGIAGRRKDRKKPTLQEVYEEVKDAAEQYQVLQVGLTLVHEDLLTGRMPKSDGIFKLGPLPFYLPVSTKMVDYYLTCYLLLI